MIQFYGAWGNCDRGFGSPDSTRVSCIVSGRGFESPDLTRVGCIVSGRHSRKGLTKMRSANSRHGVPRISPAEYLLMYWPNCENAHQAIAVRRAFKQGRSIFLWFHDEIYSALHEMESNEHEREILVRLMRATTTRTICKLTTQSRSLRGIEIGKARVFLKRSGSVVRPGRQGPRRNDPTRLHRSLLGWFLWRDPAWFLEIKANRRFPRHAYHLAKQIEFVAQGISAVCAGYQPATGIRHLSEEILRCYKCRRPVISSEIHSRGLISRNRLRTGGVPWCAEC